MPEAQIKGCGKMTTDRQKGQNWVNELKEMLQNKGYTVWKPGLKAIFIGKGRVISSSQDILECFDLVATSEKHILWIQSKSAKDTGHGTTARKKIDNLTMPNGTFRIVVERIPNVKYGFRAWIKTESDWSKPLDFKELIDELWEGIRTEQDFGSQKGQ